MFIPSILVRGAFGWTRVATATALLGLLAVTALMFAPPPPRLLEANSPPDAVGSITLTRSGSTLTVSWNAVDGAAKYHALYQADGAGDWLPPIPDYKNITATSFTFNIDSSKSYVVGVRAGNANGWGAWTDSPASHPPLPAAVGSIALNRSGSTLTGQLERRRWRRQVSRPLSSRRRRRLAAAYPRLPEHHRYQLSASTLTATSPTSSASAPATLPAGGRGPTPRPAIPRCPPPWAASP